MSGKYRILHLEDVSTDAQLVASELKKNNISFEHHVIDREEEYIKALDNFSPDVILCDHSLPSFNSHKALKILKAKKLDIPFILITATMTEQVAMTVIKEGADDFILKDRLNRLPSAVVNAIEKYRLEKERKRLIEEVDEKEALSKKLLNELTNKLLLATKASGVGIWEYVMQTGKFIGDKIILSIYGITTPYYNSSYKAWKRFLHPQDSLWIDELLQDALKKDARINFGFRIIKPDKSLHYIEASVVAERDRQGKLIRLVGTNKDITKYKAAEYAIKESEAKFRSFFESSADGILITLTSGEILSANPAACEIFQMTADEICNLGRHGIADLTDPRLNVMLEERKRTGRAKGEIRHIRKDGSKFSGEVTSAVFTDAFGQERASLIIRDITERKLTEEKLREYQEQLLESQRIAHIGSWQRDAVSIADTKSIPWMCSEEALLIMGFPADYEDMTYEKFFSIVHPADVEIVKKAAQEITHSHSYYKIDHRIILPGHIVKWVHRDAKFIKDTVTGHTSKIIGTIQDITEQKLAEFALQKSNKEREMLINELTNSLKDLKQFTYITSHNFKAPLSNLIGLLSLVDYSTLNKDTKDIVDMFKASTLQLNKTITDLVEILIIRSNVNVNIANNNISTLFNDVCSSLTYEINEIGCVISKDFTVNNIYFNKSYLESIVLNLLSNAIKYRSRNRKLKIRVSTKQKPDGDVELIIKDNGIGIDLSRHRDRVFGLYQRFHSNVDGVGLGLFIVRSQLSALGGDINIESEVDKGTCFYLTFKQNEIPEGK